MRSRAQGMDRSRGPRSGTLRSGLFHLAARWRMTSKPGSVGGCMYAAASQYLVWARKGADRRMVLSGPPPVSETTRVWSTTTLSGEGGTGQQGSGGEDMGRPGRVRVDQNGEAT